MRRKNEKAAANPVYMDWFRQKIYDLYVIKPENVPESFFLNQIEIARNAGRGELELDEWERQRLISIIIKDQKSSLDVWIEYFMSDNSKSYPMWFKFWAFQGLTKIGKYDDERASFSKRNLQTTAPFADLNSEILSLIADKIIAKLNGDSLDDLDDPEFKRLIEKENFVELYTHEFTRFKDTVINFSSTNGVWKTFAQGSDPRLLTRALRGKATGWCTAGLGFAEDQIEMGDFHIFFTEDNDGEFTQPRIAIRMEDDVIAEVRGIAVDQNLDDRIAGENLLEEKLREFGDEGAKYLKKTRHMKRLTQIQALVESGESLSSEDLRFLYEVDEFILGFGYDKDPRIEELLEYRNHRYDLTRIFDCTPDRISLTAEEAVKGDILYHYGDLDLDSLITAVGLDLPEYIKGDLSMDSLESLDGLILKNISGDIFLPEIPKDMRDEIKPLRLGGDIILGSRLRRFADAMLF